MKEFDEKLRIFVRTHPFACQVAVVALIIFTSETIGYNRGLKEVLK